MDFPPSSSQSDWAPQTGSLGETHWISTPGLGHRPTDKAESRFTKLVYALHPDALTLIMYEVDDPPALNVQHRGASPHAPDAPPSVALRYVWHRLAEEQLRGELRRVSEQLRYKMVLLLVTLKGRELLSWIPWWEKSSVTQVEGSKREGAMTRRWDEAEMDVIG